jgi:hypothetical protein
MKVSNRATTTPEMTRGRQECAFAMQDRVVVESSDSYPEHDAPNGLGAPAGVTAATVIARRP